MRHYAKIFTNKNKCDIINRAEITPDFYKIKKERR